MSVKNRIIKALYANGFGQLVTVSAQLMGVPIFLKYWGIGLYGEWLLLSTFPAYLAMSDLGFASVAGNEMTMQVARHEHSKALKTFQTTLVCLAAATIFVFVIVGILILSNHLIKWIPVSFFRLREIDIVLLFFGGQVTLVLLGGALVAGFRCEGNYPFVAFWKNVLRMIEFAGLFGVVVSEMGVVAAAASVFLVRATGTVLLCFSLLHRSPWLSFGFRESSLKEAKRLLKPAIAFMAFPVGNALSQQGVVMVVGLVIGPIAVVILTTLRTLTRLIYQTMGLINYSVWPELSAAYGAGNLELSRQLHLRSVQWAFWLALTLAVFLAFSGEWIYVLWTGAKVVFDAELFWLLLLAGVFNSLWLTSSVVPAAINEHAGIAKQYILVTSFTLVMVTLLTPFFGLIGVGLSFVVAEIFMALVVVRESVRLLDENLKFFLKEVFHSPLIQWRSLIRFISIGQNR